MIGKIDKICRMDIICIIIIYIWLKASYPWSWYRIYKKNIIPSQRHLFFVDLIVEFFAKCQSALNQLQSCVDCRIELWLVLRKMRWSVSYKSWIQANRVFRLYRCGWYITENIMVLWWRLGIKNCWKVTLLFQVYFLLPFSCSVCFESLLLSR